MYQQERLNAILRILKENHYATVDYLVEEIHYSPASIRRDLTLLEKQGLVKRSYGGVQINQVSDTPFKFRQHLMKLEKNKIAYVASKLIDNGDIVFLDGSTTAQFMGQYITEKKDIVVITNNIMLASYLKENGICVYCSGGELTELPGTLSGVIAANTFSSFHADKMFFSTDGVDQNGIITVKTDGNYIHNKAMLENSDKHIFLCGSDKVGKYEKLVQCTMSDIDYFITDKKLDDNFIKKYPKTEFIYT